MSLLDDITTLLEQHGDVPPLAEIEQVCIRNAFRHHSRVVDVAAALGMGRATLYRRLVNNPSLRYRPAPVPLLLPANDSEGTP